MTAQELIESLSRLDPDTEIRLMSQPSWPFEYSLQDDLWEPPTADSGCVECGYPEDGHTEEDADHDFNAYDGFEPEGNPAKVAYLVEGYQLAYGTKDAWN